MELREVPSMCGFFRTVNPNLERRLSTASSILLPKFYHIQTFQWPRRVGIGKKIPLKAAAPSPPSHLCGSLNPSFRRTLLSPPRRSGPYQSGRRRRLFLRRRLLLLLRSRDTNSADEDGYGFPSLSSFADRLGSSHSLSSSSSYHNPSLPQSSSHVTNDLFLLLLLPGPKSDRERGGEGESIERGACKN